MRAEELTAYRDKELVCVVFKYLNMARYEFRMTTAKQEGQSQRISLAVAFEIFPSQHDTSAKESQN